MMPSVRSALQGDML